MVEDHRPDHHYREPGWCRRHDRRRIRRPLAAGRLHAAAVPDGDLHDQPDDDAAAPYDTDKDLVPIARAAASDAFVVVNPNVPVRSIQELVAYAKAHPGTLRFGSAGNGTITQLQCEIFGDHAGVRLEHVPYRGSGLAVNDLVAGHIQMMCDPATLPMVRQGQLRPLATFGEQRHPEFPNVPTLMESGLADRGAMSWFGIAAPAGTPLPVRERIAATLEQALKSEDVARGLALGGLRPAFEQGEAFANRITGDRAIFAEIIRRTGAGVN
jgi:tripartite-type tricarboxylate transporter receptor subunit TctC